MASAEHKNTIGVHSTVPVLVILSGPGRGRSETLSEKTCYIKLGEDESVNFIVPDGEEVRDHHATLHRYKDTYEIEVAAEHNIWVNGHQVMESHVLASGDLLEIGHKGPLLRYRIYPDGHIARKSFNELVSDCFYCARAEDGTRVGKSYRFISSLTHDLATQTTLWFRIWVVIILTLLVISIAFLIMQNVKLQKSVVKESIRIESLEQLLARQESNVLSQQELLDLQAEVKGQLAGTFERLEQLETGTGKTAQVIAESTPAIVFLLGSYGFRNQDTGLLYRYRKSVDGHITRFTFDEAASLVEIPFTGTAFVAAPSGVLITNQHVMEPWRNTSAISTAEGDNLVPVIIRLYAYYPGIAEPAEITELQISENFDLALHWSSGHAPPFRGMKSWFSVTRQGSVHCWHARVPVTWSQSRLINPWTTGPWLIIYQSQGISSHWPPAGSSARLQTSSSSMMPRLHLAAVADRYWTKTAGSLLSMPPSCPSLVVPTWAYPPSMHCIFFPRPGNGKNSSHRCNRTDWI